MTALAQVVQFPSTSKTVWEVYNSFISMHEKNSNRTANEYASRVKEFFQLTLKKNVEDLTIEEIQDKVKKADVQIKFIDELAKRGNKFSTIKTKLNSVRSFYNELLANDLRANPMIFKFKLPDDGEHHDPLSRDELLSLFEFLKKEKEFGLEKYLVAKTLFTTANRKTATFNMTWKDNFITQKDINTGEEIHVIKVMDKGNQWIYKPISDEFYEELQQLNHGQEKVFGMATKTFERALKRFSKATEIVVKPHALKSTAITLGYAMSRDINLCKQLGGHSSIVTTEIYLHEEKSLVNQLSYNMSREVDESILENISREELLDFINENEDIKMAILLRLGR